FRKAEDESDNLKMSRFDLISFAREIYLCFGHQAQQQHISYQFTATEEQLEIIADKEKLEIVLYNLLSNAFKFTPENGKIDFSIQKENQQIQLTIADTGIGIPEEVGDNIFTKFYSDSRKGVKQKPGFGIG